MARKYITNWSDLSSLTLEELNPQVPDSRCSLCRCEWAPIPEGKPSGPNLDIQVWYHCQRCWDYLLELRKAIPVIDLERGRTDGFRRINTKA